MVRRSRGLAAVAAALAAFGFAAATFVVPIAGETSPRLLRGSNAGALAGVSSGTRNPQVSRAAIDIDFSDSLTISVCVAVVAGLVIGVLLAQVMESAAVASQERGNVSESLKAKMSADAGMEDVEDDAGENNKANSLIADIARAQGIAEDEVEALKKKKVVVDDGW
mmetsp:Transcript_43652/g.59267  ORF Transcript_43652/g.59267 Transcript_43652/m.59267 type:complete len:166 (+) Transcript_43652:54-551(+)